MEPGSPADRACISKGDEILAVDGESMRDIVDYYLLVADDVPHRMKVRSGGQVRLVEVAADVHGPGIEMQDAVFGEVMRCLNDCSFCFVDQLPAGLRDSLYVKDDDYRLSFLQGNFITLTNLDVGDLERIIDERLSPLYVSLHCTDPGLRERIFGSHRANSALKNMEMLLEGGIELHVQIVLMKGVNDADVLDGTLDELGTRYEGVSSIGVVPVGLSNGGRKKPPPSWGYDTDSAISVIEQIERWRPTLGNAGPFAADEFFFLAGLEAPAADYYGPFPQTENGIGLARLFRDWFREASWRRYLPSGCEGTAIITAPMGRWALDGLGLDETGACIVTCGNSLFGDRVNVCGLMPGSSVVETLLGSRFDRALVPGVALDERGRFIDGMSVSEVGESCGVSLENVAVNGAEVVKALWNAAEIQGEKP